MDQILLAAILLAALVLFVTEAVRADLVAVGVLLALYFGGLVTAAEAFSGFSNPAVITVIAMFILSAGLVHTGVADWIGRGLLRLCGPKPAAITAGSMLVSGGLSAFMNNIGAVAVLMPSMFSIAKKTGISPGKLLMPLSFGALLGGLVTMIGTPPNLLLSMALVEHGFKGFRLFDFAPTGLVVLGVGVFYMVLIGRHLIPDRASPGGVSGSYQLDEYLTEIVVPETSAFVGKSYQEASLRGEFGLNILRVRRERGGRVFWYVPGRDSRIEAGDRLVAQGDMTQLLAESRSGLLEIYAEKKFVEAELTGDGMRLAEVVISPNSNLIGHSIRDFDVRRVLGVVALALKRGSRNIVRDFASVPLDAGDVLLVQGMEDAFAEMSASRDFLLVSPVRSDKRSPARAPIALAIMVAVVLLASLTPVDISIAAMSGALLMAVTRCLRLDEIYQAIDWKVVFLIAGMIPLGLAMDANHTGVADWLAGGLVQVAGDASPLFVMGALLLFTTLITEVMSNAAAAVLLAPISIAVSNAMGIEPYPFLMAIAIGASTTFLTPIGHQSNVLIYGVGNYKFADFARAGAPLNAIIFVVTLIAVPIFWPFRPL